MDRKAKVRISKLVLEIGGKKIELTIKQVKELQEVLNDSFGPDSVLLHDPTFADDYTTSPAEYTTSTAQ